LDVLLPSELQQLVDQHFEVIGWDTLEKSLEIRQTVVALFVFLHPVIDNQLMERLPNLKVISNFGVGVDHIRVNEAKQRNIPTGNTPDCLNDAVADLAVGLCLAAARNIVSGDHFAKDPNTIRFNPNWFGVQFSGCTLGILGMGRIGEIIAKKVIGFDTKTLYYNRHPKSAEFEAKMCAQYVPLDILLQQSDFIVIVVPSTPETSKMIGKKQIELMKKTAFLINVARGAIVDHDALVDALREKKIAGAALDVTDPEPLPRDHPLLKMDNVIVTPHIGSATFQTRKKMTEMTIQNIFDGLAARRLSWLVE